MASIGAIGRRVLQLTRRPYAPTLATADNISSARNASYFMHKYTLPLLLFLLSSFATDAPAADWSHWRGPQQNGTAADKGLPEKWSSDPADNDNLVWMASVGGRTTPIVQNGHVYLITRAGENPSKPRNNELLQERVVCLNEKTGAIEWQHKFNVFLTDIVKDRLGWTTMAGDPQTGYVYAHGTQGLLFCFDQDGKVVWQHSLNEEYGRVSGYGGRIGSPIVDGELLFFSMVNANWGDQAIGRTRFVAMDKRTGAVVWWASTGFPVKDTYMSTPVVANIDGQRLVIGGGGDGGVHAFKANTGEKVWSYIFGGGAVNISPVVDGNHIYIGHGETNTDSALQGRVICLDASKVTAGKPALVWQKDGIKAKFASPIIDKGKLYICNEAGFLYCLKADDGEQLWQYKYGKSTKGSPVLADGKIYIGETDNHFYILKPGDKKCDLLHSEEFEGSVEVNGAPAVVNGHVYVMTTKNVFCIGKKDAPVGAVPPPAPAEVAKKDAPAAHIQVYPADIVLHPGDSFELKARAYDDHGRLIGPVKAEWSLAGPLLPEGIKPPPDSQPPPALKAELSDKAGESTKVTIAKAPPGQFGRVLATVGKLTGEVRVRVAWTLPVVTDFSKVPEGRAPGGWVNTQGKFEVVKLDDRSVLQKTVKNPSPLVARANAFIGLPSATDYTIEADVRAGEVNGDLPDMGVVANRYTFFLVGKQQALRLVTWDAVPRIDNTIVYGWQPNVWYHMKLTVKIEGDKAVARGKIWPRDKEEPKDWTLEITDPIGNKEGSPALYGNAIVKDTEHPGTPIYYDNVKVTPNKKAE
jgi:outer membrane protein assembly factor BamB